MNEEWANLAMKRDRFLADASSLGTSGWTDVITLRRRMTDLQASFESLLLADAAYKAARHK